MEDPENFDDVAEIFCLPCSESTEDMRAMSGDGLQGPSGRISKWKD